MRQERKYCEAAQKMLATLKRGESRKWMNLANTVAAMEKHYANCKRGCGRKIEGPWPPK